MKLNDSNDAKTCGMVVMKDVLRDGLVLTPQELAVKCNITVINAEKIMAGFKNTELIVSLLIETTTWAANHTCNNVTLNVR